VKTVSKANIGIKATEEQKGIVHSLLNAAKELGVIKENNAYFEITSPYFEEWLKKQQLTKTSLGYAINEIERATTIITNQFMSIIESHETIVRLNKIKHEEEMQKKGKRIETLTSLLEKTENLQLKGKIKELENKLAKMELKHEREISRLDKE